MCLSIMDLALLSTGMVLTTSCSTSKQGLLFNGSPHKRRFFLEGEESTTCWGM